MIAPPPTLHQMLHKLPWRIKTLKSDWILSAYILSDYETDFSDFLLYWFFTSYYVFLIIFLI